MLNELVALKEEIQNCSKCGLRENTNIPCWDNGNTNSKVMFLGEAEGKEESLTGIPFIGRCGQYLERCMNGIGIERSDIFISNTCMCRPVEKSTNKDRPPTQEEIAICSPYLIKQIELIKPRLIVSLGRVPFKFLTDSQEPMMKAKGKLYSYIHNTDIKVFPLMHPSYIITYATPEMISNNWSDWLKLKGLLHEYE